MSATTYRVAAITAGLLLSAVAFASSASASEPPVNVQGPTVTGAPAVGATLSLNAGTWTGDPVPTFSYQWQRCVEGPVTSGVFGTTGTAPSGIAIDVAGNVYTANSASQDVTKITPDGTSSILAPALASPAGIVVDSAGNVFTANPGSYDVTRITPDGTPSIFAQTGSGGAYALTLDYQDNIYTANIGSNDVTKILNPTGSRSIFGSTGTYPNSIEVDEAGNVYTANLFDDSVTRIASDGTSSVFGNTGDGPYGLTLDSAGNVYTANSGAGTVTRITPEGTASTLGTTGTNPFSVVVDAAGYVYTANFGSANVTRISPDGQSSVLAAAGNQPYAIALDSSGRVYTANLASNNVTRITQTYDCEDIGGATSSTYTQTGADVGKRIRVQVTATNGVEPDGEAESTPTAPVPGAPQNTEAPTISGDPGEGETLTASNGRWAAYPAPSFTHQWQRCDDDGANCADITGAEDPSYILARDDVGKRIRVEVTAENDSGSSDATSQPFGPVEGSPTLISQPTISGTPQVDQTLSANPGTWGGYPAATFEYQWQRCDGDGVDCVDIPPATDSSYSLTGPDVSRTIRVEVIATNSQGSAGTTSDTTSVISPAPAKPKLQVTVKAPKTVKAGRSFSLEVRALNQGGPLPPGFSASTATNVRTCVTLPSGMAPASTAGGRKSGRTICWTLPSLNAGTQAIYRPKVKTARKAKRSATFRATVTGGSVAGSATASGSGRVKVKPAR